MLQPKKNKKKAKIPHNGVLAPNVVPTRETISPQSLVILGIPRNFTGMSLDDFKCNNDAMKEVKKFVKDYTCEIGTKQRNSYQKGIFFYGSNGVGKSMLSCIILKVAYKFRYSCRRITFYDYIKSYTSAWSNESETTTLWETAKSCSYLVLEEIGKEVDTKISKPILEDLLRYREEHSLTTIICTNCDIPAVEGMYGSSIMSIIKGSMTPIKIVGKDRRS